jgi:transposase InsO family protein
LIHHSDHGVQYTCHAYRNRLAQKQIRSSLGEVGNCYDNATAERVNGILKLEYGLGERLLDFDHAQALTNQAVWLYNHDRPHLSLDYKLPVDVHFSTLHKFIRS